MISNYKKAKEGALKIYHDFLPLITCIKDGKTTSYDNSLVSLAKQAENIEQDKFLLMIVGEAKSGKSTFINAYLGEEILPMDVKQCTSAIVEIRYGQRFILTATYADDRTKTIEDEKRIKEFLVANAAMNDNYRDIPVSAINIELLMHKKDTTLRERTVRIRKVDGSIPFRSTIKITTPDGVVIFCGYPGILKSQAKSIRPAPRFSPPAKSACAAQKRRPTLRGPYPVGIYMFQRNETRLRCVSFLLPAALRHSSCFSMDMVCICLRVMPFRSPYFSQ